MPALPGSFGNGEDSCHDFMSSQFQVHVSIQIMLEVQVGPRYSVHYNKQSTSINKLW